MFAATNKELLESMLPPAVAVNYYKNEDLYMVRPRGRHWNARCEAQATCNACADAVHASLLRLELLECRP